MWSRPMFLFPGQKPTIIEAVRSWAIMPPGFSFPFRTDLWMPTEQTANLQRRDWSSFYFVFGRLVDGVTMADAQVELKTIGRRLENAYPQTNQMG